MLMTSARCTSDVSVRNASESNALFGGRESLAKNMDDPMNMGSCMKFDRELFK